MKNNTFSFQRELRLLSARDFSRVFDKALKVHNKAFTLLARKNQFDHPRLGLVIAKKNLKLAVQRNRVKRLLREYFRLNTANIPSFDLVVLTRREIAQLSKEDIIRYRNDLFERFERKCARS